MSIDEVALLRAEIARLSERIDELEGRSGTAPRSSAATSTGDGSPVSRRQMMRGAAAAAIGGTALALGSSAPVAADDPNDIALGERKATAGLTQADSTSTGGGAAFLFQSGTSFAAGSVSQDCALAGVGASSEHSTGVYGFTFGADPDASGVRGEAGGPAPAVSARANGGPALFGQSNGYGLSIEGALAAAVLTPSSDDFPTDSAEFHRGGELYVREASDSGLAVELWYCTVGGTPGEWVQIAGPGTPGPFRPVTPTRVYDSRTPEPSPGRISAGEERVISVADARDLTSGASLGGLVPDGATALTFNVAVVDTDSRGFLSVAPSFATEVSAASINWSDAGQVLNNGSITQLGDTAEIKVFAGGLGSTDFVIDVTGYWT